VIKYTARELAETVEHLYLRQAAKLISGAKQLLADKAEELRDEAQELIDGLAMPPTHN
jgi:chorismate mutase